MGDTAIGLRGCGVYALRCVPTGECYVGVTQDLATRRKTHLSRLRVGKHSNRRLQALYREHGPPAFVWEVLERITLTTGGKRMAAVLADAEARWEDHLNAERPGSVISHSRAFNIWVAFPGWTWEDDCK